MSLRASSNPTLRSFYLQKFRVLKGGLVTMAIFDLDLKAPLFALFALEIEFTRSQIVAAIPGTFFCAWYASQKHWLANNILGLAFCIQVG
ncbi:Signal peptide peptidase [Morella rubra]|uniref:Signal peptide peptidase n=1 Tax=Morella rubra TaxID=262757 RepID=A0A6A1WGX6_9ROSI|nr:Signal peptide peptidase [Morella rubra]